MTPGNCPHELETVRFARTTKSLCNLRSDETWTNCRDVGRCYRTAKEPPKEPTKPKKRGQLTFDFDEEGRAMGSDFQ